ncbi:MAG: hypothetical protein ACRDYZ_10350 [Acidimicrobiales bacterium]
MPELSCADCEAVVAEAALGVADARERAEVIGHLDRCSRCRASLAAMSEVADGLVALVPMTEPPAGFESRVMAAVGHAPSAEARPAPAARRRRPVVATVTAVAVIAAVGAGAWFVTAGSAGPSRPAAPAVVTAALRAGQRTVGEVVVVDRSVDGSRPWMSVALDAGPPRAQVRCEVTGPGGATTALGTFQVAGGYAYWAAALPTGTTVRRARLVLADGSVLATAVVGSSVSAVTGA